ncbi:hypothetical protein [Pseudalkalibacillus hwajinpoensis]|uniref:Uncharacterized protein n=1 Tax=Guptibacillus hwajinpoensis TaxID=208199 RepID=A0A4U1MNB0_9BACL|nr:hypothetical protein [Pseudalkalibacillus hwajinpoensis]TKD72216.1 hypothetical protein FBF83_05320 [Pseudalkalibacillus hwajinpoensis]
MNKKEAFSKWLSEHTNLAQSTVDKYSGAINTISSELVEQGKLYGSLYQINNSVTIDKKSKMYLSIPQFQDKDLRGNRMYSNALKYYKKYVESDGREFTHVLEDGK